MRNLRVAILALMTLASCRSMPTGRAAQESVEAGAPTARTAVAMYMDGMRAVDFKLVGDVWGTRQQLARERYSPEEFEKRVFVVSCYLGWLGYQITSERPAVDGGTRVEVQSTRRGKAQQAALRLEENSSGRWFVAAADLSDISPDHCG